MGTLEKWVVGTFAAVAVILLACLAIAACHRITCKRGHYETRHFPAYTYMTFIQTGKTSVPITHFVSEHDARVWICDESERPR